MTDDKPSTFADRLLEELSPGAYYVDIAGGDHVNGLRIPDGHHAAILDEESELIVTATTRAAACMAACFAVVRSRARYTDEVESRLRRITSAVRVLQMGGEGS